MCVCVCVWVCVCVCVCVCACVSIKLSQIANPAISAHLSAENCDAHLLTSTPHSSFESPAATGVFVLCLFLFFVVIFCHLEVKCFCCPVALSDVTFISCIPIEDYFIISSEKLNTWLNIYHITVDNNADGRQ